MFLVLLILLAGDVETNPGPVSIVRSTDTSFLFEKIDSECVLEWKSIGMALGFSSQELNSIPDHVPDPTPRFYFKELLDQWCQWPSENHPEIPSLERLSQALRATGFGVQANIVDKISLPSSEKQTYEGEFCQNDVDGCRNMPCFPGVECVDNPAPDVGATCGSCPEGYSQNEGKCLDIDECAGELGDLCSEGCVNFPGGYVCSNCSDGFELINDTQCRAGDTLNLERYDAYKKALAEGDTVPMQYLKCYLVGIPQIGKTTVMERLTDEIQNLSLNGGKPTWSSTGVKQSTIIAVKNEDSSEWSMTVSKDELQDAIKLYCNTDKFQSSTAVPLKNDNSNVKDSEEVQTSTVTITQADLLDTIPEDIRDIVKSFDSKLKETGGKVLNSKEVQMLLMIDVGGQSSFLEMLPLLMKGPSMYLTFFKLSENPMEDSYFDQAKYSVGDVIIQILSGIALSRCPNEQVRKVIEESNKMISEDAITPYNDSMYRTIAFLIGTHKDLIKGNDLLFRFLSFIGYKNLIDTKLVEIDDSFEKRIEEVFGSEEDIVAWAECRTATSKGKLIFAMDNMNGSKKEIQELRSRLMDEAKKMGNFHIPVRWLLFGIVLRKEYEWITMNDCIILAQLFHIPEEEVDSVLWFLSSVTGMLLYQPDIKYEPLQKIIFCNPQIIFDNVSELIIENVDTSGDKSLINCLEERGKFFPIKLNHRTHVRDNFISFEDLQQSVRRHVNKKVLMPIEALVQFLKDRKIVAPCPLPKGQEGDIPYIMPATLDYGSVDHLVCQDDAAAPCPLFLKFTYYLPPGLFSCLITNIFNEYSNCDEDCIKEVKKNYISFYDQARIVLISSSKWLEVRVLHYNSSFLNTKRQACFHVIKIVSGMVSKVMKDLNFNSEYDFFIKCGPDHYVPIKSDVSCKDGQHYVYCKVKGNIIISQAQQCWFSSKDATPNTTSHKRELVDLKKAVQPSKQELLPRREFEPVPLRQETITSEGGEINLMDEIGATLSIPRNSTDKDEQINFAAGFSGSYEMPAGVESVSPAYLIKTTNEVEFHEPLDLTLQHNSNLQTAEDCKEMVFLKASIPSTAHKDSDSKLKFEKIDNASTAVKFSQGEGQGRFKLKKIFSWFKIGRKQSGKKKERFYSARLYKAVIDMKVTAIFCVCLEHPLYIKHCDKVIPLEYSVKAKEKTKTIFSRVIINSDKVDLVMREETKTWTLFMDRSGISKKEVDYPECEKIKFSELSDYPPRIVIDLTPTVKASDPAVLDVMGLKDNRCFRIANDYVPNLPRPAEVSTQLLQDATKKLKTRISKNLISDSPMVTCARDMVRIMTEVEKLLHDPSSINELVKKVEEIQEQVKNVIRLSEGVNDVENHTTKVSTISQQFKTVASVMHRCSADNPESWTAAIEVLVPNSTILMEAISEVLSATEIATITRRGSSHCISSPRQRSSSSTSLPQLHSPSRRFSQPHSQGAASAGVYVMSLHVNPALEDRRRPPPTTGDITFVVNNKDESYKLINNISGEWRRIGSLLGLTENQLDNIDTENKKQDQCFLAVMSKWMKNARGLPRAIRYPHSWTGLHNLLADSGVSKYADEFMIFMKHVPIPHL